MRVHVPSGVLGAVLFSPGKALRLVRKLGTVVVWWALGIVVLGRLAWQWWEQQGLWMQALIVCAVAAVVLRAPLLRVGRRQVARSSRRVVPAAVPLDQQVTFLYRWYNSAGDLLYVGISNDLARRTGQHLADKAWMAEAVRCDAKSYPDRQSALDAEERAIWSEGPRYNIVHNGRVA